MGRTVRRFVLHSTGPKQHISTPLSLLTLNPEGWKVRRYFRSCWTIDRNRRNEDLFTFSRLFCNDSSLPTLDGTNWEEDWLINQFKLRGERRIGKKRNHGWRGRGEGGREKQCDFHILSSRKRFVFMFRFSILPPLLYPDWSGTISLSFFFSRLSSGSFFAVEEKGN